MVHFTERHNVIDYARSIAANFMTVQPVKMSQSVDLLRWKTRERDLESDHLRRLREKD